MENNAPEKNAPQPADPSPGKPRLTGNFDKLNVYNWLYNTPTPPRPVELEADIVEVRFKNTRKGFYHNVNRLDLQIGDYVAVEGTPGHDIGVVSLTRETVGEQMRKYRVKPGQELKKVYRKAKATDLDKWREAIALEHATMLESRKLARDMGLNMKIGDVEYQGDKTKAIFYYIADERVDFRQLIKILADKYRIRIEMRQIGARQEAGRIGGIGACGRELCCSSWISNFVSVATNAARSQELSPNPQKLAGQCGKLKCCLNYELDAYVDACRSFPTGDLRLTSKEGVAVHQKNDIFKGLMWYALDKSDRSQIFPLTTRRVREILEMNRRGEQPDTFADQEAAQAAGGGAEAIDFHNVVGQDAADRFTKVRKKGRGKGRGRGGDAPQGADKRPPRPRGNNAPDGQAAGPEHAPRQGQGQGQPQGQPQGARRPNRGEGNRQSPENRPASDNRAPRADRPRRDGQPQGGPQAAPRQPQPGAPANAQKPGADRRRPNRNERPDRPEAQAAPRPSAPKRDDNAPQA